MIPVSRPVITEDDINTVSEAVKSGWISSEGIYIEKFEDSFAKLHSSSYGVAVSSGTAALEAALYGLGISKGDEVILSTFTIISCVLAIIRLGAIPVFVDINKEDWSLNHNQVEEMLSDRTKVVMVVHLYGNPISILKLKKLQQKYDFKILEDCAQVHGARVDGDVVGSQADASAFSFYANKLITTGEGGMVLTSNEVVRNRAKYYRNLCFDKDRKFIHQDLGNNYRMTNMQAALGYSQTKRLNQIIDKKRYWGQRYNQILSKFENTTLQIEEPGKLNVYWMYCMQLPEFSALDGHQAIEFLIKNGVGARYFFSPLHLLEILDSKCIKISGCNYENSINAYKYGLYLPSSLDLSENEFSKITNVLERLKELCYV